MAKTQVYSAEMKAREVRLVREHAQDYPSEWAAISAVAGRLSAETVRKWLRQAETDERKRPGLTMENAAEVRALKRKVAEPERTIQILTEVTRFFRPGGRPATAVICAQAPLARHAAEQLPGNEVDGLRARRRLAAWVRGDLRDLIPGIGRRIPVDRVVVKHTSRRVVSGSTH